MNRHIILGLTALVSVALGAAAVQGLHAQAKPKAYMVTEIEVINDAAQAEYRPLVQASIRSAGGRIFNTAGGKMVALTGVAPKVVAITEWDSLEQAQAWRNGSYKNLAAQRDKAQKEIRAYAVETLP
jgi:uncharacterized protein (DUF1330 family)